MDALLNLPYLLIGLRNKLLPVNPHRLPPRSLPPTQARQERPSPRNPARILPAPEGYNLKENTPVKEEETVQPEDDGVKSEPETDMSSQSSVESSWINLDVRSQHEGTSL